MLRMRHCRMFAPRMAAGSYLAGYGVIAAQVYSFVVTLCKRYSVDLLVPKAERWIGSVRKRVEW